MPLHTGMVHWPGDAPFELRRTESISNGAEANVSEIRTTAHIGTHVDAPLHYFPDAAPIDSMPIAATCGRARVIAIRDPNLIRVEELQQHNIGRHERLLFKTINSERCGDTAAFETSFVHVPRTTANYLAGRGVQCVGVDYLSIGGAGADCAETHRILLRAGVWIIEGLRLAQVVPGEYELFCLPLKLQGSDGAPARAVLRSFGSRA